jgi:hypothetical protein
MRTFVLATALLPLLVGTALARGSGGHGGAAHGGSGPGYGGPDPASLGPLAATDWRVQWVQRHEQVAPVAGPVGQQAPAS